MSLSVVKPPKLLVCMAVPRGIDYDLVERLVVHICTASQYKVVVPGAGNAEAFGAVLVFLTGVGEVSRMCQQLEKNPALQDKSKYRILPLHSALPPAQQAQVFERVIN